MPKLPNQGADEEPRQPLNATERLAEGWEPAAPTFGLDGLPGFEMKRLLPVIEHPPSPTLCSYGPCENFHEMEVQLDAATPMDGTGGEIRGVTVRTCYPAPGIEWDVTMPVWKCNRFAPEHANTYAALKARDEFGVDLAAWRKGELERREAETKAIQEMMDEPEPEAQKIDIVDPY